MNILAIDTSTSFCSVGVLHHENLFSQTQKTEHKQAENLVPLIQKVMKKAGVSFKNLDCIAIITGPGSFTGIRIGVATAKALALAAHIPFIGLTAFEAIIHSLPEAKRKKYDALLVALETHREDFYTQLFSSQLKPLSQPKAATSSDIQKMLPKGNILIIGNADKRLYNKIKNEHLDLYHITCIDIKKVLNLAKIKKPTRHVKPLYLRAPYATPPISKRH